MTLPLLSIVIPTRNQPEAVITTLRSIAPQLNDEVEVVLNDNSTDETTAAMVRREFSHPRIRYFRDEPGLGIDRYILFGIERAHGTYIWWMGDDEIGPGGVDHIIQLLRAQPDTALVWINHYVAGQNIPALPFGEDMVFKDRNHALRTVANLFAFASSIVFKKKSVANVDEKKMARFVGTGFVNFYLTMHILAGPGTFSYVGHPYVSAHPTTVSEMKRNTNKDDGTIVNRGFEVHGIMFAEVVKSFHGSFNHRAIRHCLSSNFRHLWRGMLVGWAGGWDTPKGKRFLILKYYGSHPGAWIAFFLFLLPRSAIVALYKIYRLLFRKRSLRWGDEEIFS